MWLIAGGHVWQGSEKGFVDGLDILVKGSRIVAVGPGLRGSQSAEGAHVIDASGHIVIPGLVNAHTHVAMTLLRSYADDLPLFEWLNEKIWPVEAKLTADDVYWGTMLGIVEMVRAGVTTFSDMYFFMEDVARAVRESGVRACLSEGMFDGGLWDRQFDAARNLAADWHEAENGRIRVMLGPHSPYATLEGLKKVAKSARELGVGVHIHLSETAREVEESRKTHGLSPIQVAEREGLFEAPVLAAHCVHVDDADMEILQRYGASVAHNPTSNMKLGSGRAPVQAMLARGINVALATDGASSNNNLDLLEEARLAAYLAKMEGDPSALPAATCLDMATRRGAQALGFDDVGAIEPGFQADIVLIEASGPQWTPLHDACANLIYSAASSDVSTVMVAGEIIMERRILKTIDERRVLQEAARRGLDLVSRR